MTINSVKDFANSSEEEVYDIMFDCVGDDDFYTDGGLLSANNHLMLSRMLTM